ncbi:hypothetical protein [Victivallis sp.]
MKLESEGKLFRLMPPSEPGDDVRNSGGFTSCVVLDEPEPAAPTRS